MERRTLWAVVAAAAILVAGCAVQPTTPSVPTPIGANQAFHGLVNGTGDGAVVTTVCPGPGTPGRRGRALGGQTLSATRDASSTANTGDNGAIFVEPNATMQVTQLRNWDEAVPFPTDIDVPCDGTGVIVFDPCFGFVGCRGGAQADSVKVTFDNIAV